MQRIDPQDPPYGAVCLSERADGGVRCRQRGPRLSLRLQRQPETRRAAGAGQSGERGRGTSRHGKNADDSEHRRQSADAGKNRRCRVQQQCGGGQRARQTVEIRVRGVDGRTGKPDQTAGLFRGQTAGFHARPYVAVAGGGTHGPANAAGRAVGGHRRAFPRQRGAGRPADETLLCPMRVPSSAVGTTAGRSADAAGRPLFLPSDRQRRALSFRHLVTERWQGGRPSLALRAGLLFRCGAWPGKRLFADAELLPAYADRKSTKPISPSSRPASPGSGHRPTSSVRRA